MHQLAARAISCNENLTSLRMRYIAVLLSIGTFSIFLPNVVSTSSYSYRNAFSAFSPAHLLFPSFVLISSLKLLYTTAWSAYWSPYMECGLERMAFQLFVVHPPSRETSSKLQFLYLNQSTGQVSLRTSALIPYHFFKAYLRLSHFLLFPQCLPSQQQEKLL